MYIYIHIHIYIYIYIYTHSIRIWRLTAPVESSEVKFEAVK